MRIDWNLQGVRQYNISGLMAGLLLSQSVLISLDPKGMIWTSLHAEAYLGCRLFAFCEEGIMAVPGLKAE